MTVEDVAVAVVATVLVAADDGSGLLKGKIFTNSEVRVSPILRYVHEHVDQLNSPLAVYRDVSLLGGVKEAVVACL